MARFGPFFLSAIVDCALVAFANLADPGRSIGTLGAHGCRAAVLAGNDDALLRIGAVARVADADTDRLCAGGRDQGGTEKSPRRGQQNKFFHYAFPPELVGLPGA